MSPDWVIAWALAVGAGSAAVAAVIALKGLIGRKDPDRFSNPQIDAVVDSLRLEIDDLRAWERRSPVTIRPRRLSSLRGFSRRCSLKLIPSG